MPLVICVAAVRYSAKESLEQSQCSIHILLVESLGYTTSRIGGSKCV